MPDETCMKEVKIMNSANLKILRGEVRPRADLMKSNPIAYNGHSCLFKTIPFAKKATKIVKNLEGSFDFKLALNPNTAPPRASRQGTLQEALAYWKGQKVHIPFRKSLKKILQRKFWIKKKMEYDYESATGDPQGENVVSARHC